MQLTLWGMLRHLGLEEVARLGETWKIMEGDIESLISHYKAIKEVIDDNNATEDG